jgi:hypothetical protein
MLKKAERTEKSIQQQPAGTSQPKIRRPWHQPDFSTLDVKATSGGGGGGGGGGGWGGGGGGGNHCWNSWKCS